MLTLLPTDDTTPPEPPMSDQEHIALVRVALDHLNDVVRQASREGLSLRIEPTDRMPPEGDAGSAYPVLSLTEAVRLTRYWP